MTITITQDLEKVVSDREQEVATLLLAAALRGDSETVDRMLTKSRTVKMLIQRGVLRVEGVGR